MAAVKRSPIIWLEEFDNGFRVHHDILRYVEAGILEDVSSRLDPCPSFAARLKDRNWVRLWVEYPTVDHPGVQRYRSWPDRYTVMVQPDPTILFGFRIVGTNDVGVALWSVLQVIREKNPGWRFRIAEAAP